MPEDTKLSEIQNLTAAEVIEQVGELPADELAALRELEAGSSNRKTVLEAIDKALAARATNPAAVAKPASANTPDWQREDYAGGLTIPQAEWRRHNIKPAGGVRTK
ncbi:hypothetical protein [Stenotrophomonas sp. MMGLT7]|uniref:hypothetical protein n=1 Tax=Stenotrophomonas sp. MMGLT7 TaxID=2901227 RepID=UPI001E421182|nr:hypothetical protein [Stenotrophomonas sp. MMGLT7]MCD7096944.1 hypothetical protein [Stenotrophomonas sp. MMGLT7]